MDSPTVLNLAYMSHNAYHHTDSSSWIDIGGNWKAREKFGWEEDGIRGYVFHDIAKELAVISFKGTSGSIFGGGTSIKDRYNDNMMFSCCSKDPSQSKCELHDAFRHHSSIHSGQPRLHQCSFTCLKDQITNEPDLYIHLAVRIFNTVQNMYPKARIWLTGHSLGGSLAALTAVQTFSPAITFSAPGERIMSERAQAFPSRNFPNAGISKKDWTKALDLALGKLPIYHVGNIGDPVFTGRCNGFRSSCQFAGYSMESKCHLGKTCTFGKNLALNIRHHQLDYLIKNYLETGEEVECVVETDCEDCQAWEFVNMHSHSENAKFTIFDGRVQSSAQRKSQH